MIFIIIIDIIPIFIVTFVLIIILFIIILRLLPLPLPLSSYFQSLSPLLTPLPSSLLLLPSLPFSSSSCDCYQKHSNCFHCYHFHLIIAIFTIFIMIPFTTFIVVSKSSTVKLLTLLQNHHQYINQEKRLLTQLNYIQRLC